MLHDALVYQAQVPNLLNLSILGWSFKDHPSLVASLQLLFDRRLLPASLWS
jgi:hypothetical protein